MIRTVHFADYHLGLDTMGPLDPETRLNGRVMDYLDMLDSMIDYAEENSADLALFAGDAFHKHNPDPTYQREFGERILRLAEVCPVLLLVGNHDMPGSLEKASAVDIFATLNVPNVFVGWDYDVHVIETKAGKVQVATVPYPIRSQLLTPAELHNATDVKGMIRQRMGRIINKLEKRIDPAIPAVLLGHFSVDTARYGAERAISIGYDAEVALSDLISQVWDYVALGHIHSHQVLHEHPPVVYAGSMERVDFGEELDRKGFVWLELDKQDTSWYFVELDARPYLTIEVDVSEEAHPMRFVTAFLNTYEMSGAVVRVLIHVAEGDDAVINRNSIYNQLARLGAYHVHSVTVKSPTMHRSRLNIKNVSLMSQEDLLKVYLKDAGIKGYELKELMSLAQDIMSEVRGEHING